MPDVRIPQTSSRVTWPSSTRGTVHITTALPLPALKPGAKDSIPIELKFPRRNFDLMMQTAALFQEAYTPAARTTERTDQARDAIHEELAAIRARLPTHMRAVIGRAPQELLDDWALSVSETLHYFGLHCAGEQNRRTMTDRWSLLPDPANSQYRQAQQTLKSAFGGVPFRLVLRHAGLRALGALASTPEGKRGLVGAVRRHLLPYILTNLGSKRLPRGRHSVKTQFLQDTASVAIIMAQDLMVKIAKGDETRQAALQRIMKGDKYAEILELISDDQGTKSLHALQRQMSLWLAERALRPAWEQYKISSPLELDPNKAYKQFCTPHRRHELRDRLNTLSTQNREVFKLAWSRRLLGRAGQAAKDFDLL